MPITPATGNTSRISNLAGNDRAYLFLLDFARRQRIKVWGRARVVEDDPALLARLVDPGYRARPERAILFTVEAWDVNCSQHITARFTETEIAAGAPHRAANDRGARSRERAAARGQCRRVSRRRTRRAAWRYVSPVRPPPFPNAGARLCSQAKAARGMNHDSYDDSYIRGILNTVKTIAMVGVSPNTSRPSYFAFKYLLERGYRMIPVNPGLAGQELLGQKVYAKLADIPEPVDMVDIFRASQYALAIVQEALALKPRRR